MGSLDVVLFGPPCDNSPSLELIFQKNRDRQSIESRYNKNVIHEFIRKTLGGKSMFENVKSIIEEQLGITDPDKITLKTNIHEDLDADSLDAVEIIMMIEDEFDVEIPDDIVEKLHTVGQIVEYLEKIK